MRRNLAVILAALCGASGLVSVGGVAAAAPVPIPLSLPGAAAFAILGHSCGGIQEKVYALGFDPVSGYPEGEVDLSTSCGGSGRGGGYHSTTYTGSADVTWDFTGAVVTDVSPSAGAPVDPTLDVVDGSGNELVNASGQATLTLAASFTPAPRVTAISSAVGPASGGTSVTVTGTGFSGATGVSFGGVPAASFSVTGDTSLTAVTPVGVAGTVDLTVTSAGGASATGPFDQFRFVAAPTVDGLSPSSGPITGGTVVTITGSGFGDATGVSFGDQAAAFTVVDDTTVMATAPAGDAVDTTTVTVTSVGGTSPSGPGTTWAYTAPTPCGSGCAFTSPASASAATGVPFTFTVSAVGGVTPAYKAKGKLPKGVTFVDNLDGTATLAGVPTATTRKPAAGTYTVKVTATFVSGTAKHVLAQTLTLTVT